MPRSHKGSYFSSIVSSASDAFVIVTGLASLGFFLLIPWLISNYPFAQYILTSIVILLLFFIVVFFKVSRVFFNAYKASEFVPPRVVKGYAVKKKVKEDKVCLLIDEHPLFYFDIYVSIYHFDSEHEELLAIGRVENIQSDGKINITLDYHFDIEDLNLIIANDATYLRKLIVKPMITETSIGELFDE
ncbi:hypothetical protein BDK62_10470 [Halomonas alkaliantarctica]|nr:hypothetical protein BDK62_10470 [Halomonas alkaliantarctica]